jgi:molybdopterin-containing oxidoreductase family iron-sulfur binding subunit
LNSEILDTNNTLNIRQGNDVEVSQFVADLKTEK